jgi:hypothetical protein
MAIRRLETLAVFTPIAIGAVFLGYAIITTKMENTVATSAGFSDASEMSAAKAAGVPSGDQWRAKLEADKARIAEQEAQRKREWDAAAPQRAAAAAKQAEAEERSRALVTERNRPVTDRMKISDQSWTTGGFDSIGMMTFTIENGNDYIVKDIGVLCRFSGNSGTHLGVRAHTVYETVKPKAKRKFAKVNIGFIPAQSARASCDLVVAERA